MRAPTLSEEATRTLEVVRQRAMDGYMLRSRTSLEADVLYKALRELQAQDLVSIKGSLAPDSIGDVFVSVPPNALGMADYVISSQR